MALEKSALVSWGMSVMSVPEIFAEKCLLCARRPACADDPNDVFVTLGPDDKDESAPDRSDGDEAIFEFGVSFVENFETVDARGEELARFLEGDAVVFLVRAVLGMVPGDLHGCSVSQWLTRSIPGLKLAVAEGLQRLDRRYWRASARWSPLAACQTSELRVRRRALIWSTCDVAKVWPLAG